MTNINTLGDLITFTRKSKKISKTCLCHGLCSITALSRYENNERFPDKFLADSLLERLNLSPYKYEFIDSEDEFQLSMLRERIEIHLIEKKFGSVKNDLENYEKHIDKNDFLHYQYIFFKRALLYPNAASKMNLLKKALQYTNCIFPNDNKKLLLTKNELKINYYLAHCMFYEHMEPEAYTFCNALHIYICNYIDTITKIDFYPDILYMLAYMEYNKNNYEKANTFISQAESIMLSTYKIKNLDCILYLKNNILSKMKKTNTIESNTINALKIIKNSNNGILTEEIITTWANTVNLQLSNILENH